MNSATWVKFLAGILLFGAWLTLVLMRIVPPGPLVDAIGYALVGLGIYHASTNSTPGSIAGLAMPLEPIEPAASPQPAVGVSTEISTPRPNVPQPNAGTLQ